MSPTHWDWSNREEPQQDESRVGPGLLIVILIFVSYVALHILATFLSWNWP